MKLPARSRTLVRAIVHGSTLLAVLSPSGLVHAQASAAGASGLEEVLVTARRKEESSQDVPVAITAFSSANLQQMNIVDTQGLQSRVPSLVVGPNGQGQRNVGSPTIRGQGATFQAAPGVALYMAEAPLPAALTLSSQGSPGIFLDLENVQVLKGPQGTLFGRNTTGGAILLSPHRPTEQMEGHVQAQVGNHEDRELQAVINVPVIEDRLLVRLAAESVDREGFTRDINWNKYRDNKDYWTARLGISWRPTDGIENYLMVYNTSSRNNGTGLVNRGFNLAAYGPTGYGICDNSAVPGLDVPCSLYQDLTDAQNARGKRKVAHGVDDYERIENWGVTDILDFEITEQATLRNIVSYSKMKLYFSYDGDGTLAPANDINPFTQRHIPRDDFEQVSEELQLQGSALGGRLDYVLGGFYYKSKPTGRQEYGGVNVCPIGFAAYCMNYTGDGSLNTFNTRGIYGVTNESRALYAQGTYDLGGLGASFDGLRLTAGYRYTWDEVDGFAAVFTLDPSGSYRCGTTNALVADPAQCEFTARLKSRKPTWTVGLDYDVLDDVMVYGKVSKGYKAGGFNTYAVRPETQTFGPEEVTSYELGVKSEFTIGDVPVRLNADVFQTDFEKIQRASGDFNPVTYASGARVLSSASAEIRGLELEAVIRPLDALEIGANLSLLDAKYKKFPYEVTSPFGHQDCSGAVIPYGGRADLSCLPMQYLVDRIASVYVQVNFSDDVSLFVNYGWSDEQHTEALVLERNQPGERLESYGLLSATFDWRRINGSGLDLSVFGTNLTNEMYRISNTDLYQAGSTGSWATIYGEPRMYGVRLHYNWGG
ncbi:MAG TPA: TonB-dependent receptor [Pseudomonadales bacterium]|nr:TonB-dependent receptor [Pseudomonadales bacterium]